MHLYVRQHATVRVGDLIDTIEYDYPAFHLSMDCFWCEVASGELKLLEAEAARWLTKEELDSAENGIPRFQQWDERWGYLTYGNDNIGINGCGPTCLSMVYVYFTHDLNGTPREIASYCEKNGYYTENGTSWSLWTEGLPALGLSGKELPLVENSMKTALDQGKLIVCSMRPGDFTTSGHYILLYDYDDTGFCVKDPNRVSNSSRTWDYDTLSPQIKNLWTISPTGF